MSTQRIANALNNMLSNNFNNEYKETYQFFTTILSSYPADDQENILCAYTTCAIQEMTSERLIDYEPLTPELIHTVAKEETVLIFCMRKGRYDYDACLVLTNSGKHAQYASRGYGDGDEWDDGYPDYDYCYSDGTSGLENDIDGIKANFIEDWLGFEVLITSLQST